MHHGKVVYEYLVDGVPAWQTHGLNSASKVFTGCVAAILADQGKLSWDKPLHDYAPQLKGTGDETAVVSRPYRTDSCCTDVHLPFCVLNCINVCYTQAFNSAVAWEASMISRSTDCSSTKHKSKHSSRSGASLHAFTAVALAACYISAQQVPTQHQLF